MPHSLLFMFVGPAEIRTIAGPIATALLFATYVSGLGPADTPITDRYELSDRKTRLTIGLGSIST